MRRCGCWLMLAVAACVGRQERVPVESRLALAATALRQGRIEVATELVQAVRRSEPWHVEAARWSAVMHDMLWNDDEAVRAQSAAIRLARRQGNEASVANLRGRLGDLLFRAGRWGESISPLEAAMSDQQEQRRHAFARIAGSLPFVRRFAGPLLTEQPLLPGQAPEFVCGTRGRLRAFAIDTGTSMTTVAAGFAEELGVRSRQAAGEVLDSAGRRLAIEVGLLPEFRIGSVDIGAVPVLIVADEALRLRDQHGGPARVPRGVLGLDLIAACRLTVDPERGSVVLELPHELPVDASVQCVRAEGRCLVPVLIEGARLWFVLDTGASHSSLTAAGLTALPGKDERAVPSFRRVRTVGGGLVAVKEVRDLVVRCSDARFVNVTLPVIHRGAAGIFPVHGVLGIDLVGRCRLTLDRGRARLDLR